MRRLLRRIAAVLPVLWPLLWVSSAAALGLGEIDVRSGLNQRFVAQIPITAASAEELETLKVSLASNAEFEKAGIERLSYLSTLRFEVKGGPAPRIEISSDQLAREPFLTLLLDVRQAGNRLVREYTVFLDPPEYRAPPNRTPEFYETAAERAARPAPTPQPAVPAPPRAPEPREPVAQRPRAEPYGEPMLAADGGRYGPVQGQETLWSIAARLRPPAATMDQMMLALYRGNPSAFEGGINGLLKGALLTVPSAEDVLAVDPQTAKEEVLRLRGQRAPVRPQPRTEPAVTSAPEPVPTVRPPPITTPVPTLAPTPAPSAAPTPAPTAEPTAQPTPQPTAEPTAGPAGEITEPVTEIGAVPADEVAPTPAPKPRVTPAADDVVATKPRPEPEAGLLETLLLPLIGGLIVLGGLGYLVSRLLARRKAAPVAPPLAARQMPSARPVEPPVVAVAKPAAAAAAAAAAPAAAAEAAARAGAAGFDTEQIKTQQIPTQQIPAAAAPAAAEPAPSDALPTDTVDFDLTGQFEAQTVQINLDANDPVSEADFHLAYGLYDEAALLLKQAAEKEPQRTDIRVKLAETYFAAGKRAEFEQCAREMKSMLPEAEWQKIAIMGQQLAPDSELFKDGAGAAAVGRTDFDLDFGTPSAVPAAAPAAAAAAEPRLDQGLDFKLEDLEAPKLEQPSLEVAPDKGEALEFDLSQFDLAESAPAAAAPAAAAKDQGNSLDFDLDLSGFDVREASEVAASAPPPPEPAPAAAPAPKAAPEDMGEIRLDDIDLGEFGGEPPTAGSDEVSTKLDLARAYVDMGDHDMARTLLDEVAQQGNAEQKKDAQALMAQLG
ncbi:FimV/HubP family polar landmark protein [Fontimonas sp. SYSU GA230001]|uniref:FimV/HubP family polar landmark protein n=1 Tax=Fontimonas sp. SYSU GA230001 TaxID=3142450 RepID=UPI0032B5AD7A